MDDTNGLWQFESQQETGHDDGKQLHEHFSFYFGGDFVIIRLISMHPLQNPPKDDFYKLKARYQNKKLQYLAPYGDWIELATFENGRFGTTGNGKKRIFKKIGADELVPWNKDLLKTDRPMFDYGHT